jgi:hypothetical protein
MTIFKKYKQGVLIFYKIILCYYLDKTNKKERRKKIYENYKNGYINIGSIFYYQYFYRNSSRYEYSFFTDCSAIDWLLCYL